MSTSLPTDSMAARFGAGASTSAPTPYTTQPEQTQPSQTTPSDSSSIAARFSGTPTQDSNDPGSFTTPNGTTLTPGQQVQHSSGATGVITGQHPDTGSAIVEWDKNHPGQKYGIEGNLTTNDPYNMSGKVARWAEQVSNDLKYGTDITGIGRFMKKMGAHGIYVGNNEAVGDFMGSIPLGILRGVKGAAESIDPQSAGAAWQSVKDMVGGGLQATEIPTMVVAPESADAEELAGQAIDKAAELASNAGNAGKAGSKAAVRPVVKAINKGKEVAEPLLHPANIGQEELQDAVHSVAQRAADEAGQRAGVTATGNPVNPIDPSPSATVRDVFRNLSQAIEARAQAAYKELDEATGGNVSRFDKELKNVENAIRNSTGVNEDADAALDARKAAIMDKQEEAFKQAEANGVPRDKVDQARADWRQKSALNDVDNHLRKSTPLTSDREATRIDPKKFVTRITALHDSGRLHEALGADNADALRDAAVKASELQAKIASRLKLAGAVAKGLGIAGAAGLGGDILRHFE